MKIGIITYTSIHCNFTNYGTVLQAWALCKSIRRRIDTDIPTSRQFENEVYLVDYCPASMIDKNPLSPFANMWDKDESLREQAAQMLPAIKENLFKIKSFYNSQFKLTDNLYTVDSIDNISLLEDINNFVVGSDSIWDIEEFGIDDVFFANANVMKRNTIAYAPSFQDSIEKFSSEQWSDVITMIESNFINVALRDKKASHLLEQQTGHKYPIVVDPTLLLTPEDYKEIESSERLCDEPYILYYSRRYNPEAEKFVDSVAKKRGLKIIEISLRSQRASLENVSLRYDAGVEEFLSLVKHAKIVITNSFHCMIFSILYQKDFYVFSRPHCHGKIFELLNTLGLIERFVEDFTTADLGRTIDYSTVKDTLSNLRNYSLKYLENAINKF